MADWLGSAIGGLFGYKGTKETNVASAQQAQKQMDFQREMSNTAVQRRMADLQKAGINPILAGSKEASSPAGQQAPVLNKAMIAMQNASTAAAINKTNAETALLKAELPKKQTWEIVWNKLKEMASSTGQSIDEIKRIGDQMKNHPDWNKPIWDRDLNNKLFGQDFYPASGPSPKAFTINGKTIDRAVGSTFFTKDGKHIKATPTQKKAYNKWLKNLRNSQ